MKLLGPQDITVDSITNTSIMYIRIKALKTDPFRQGVTIAVAVGKSLLASGTCDVSNESALRDSESVGPLSSLAMCDATGGNPGVLPSTGPRAAALPMAPC